MTTEKEMLLKMLTEKDDKAAYENTKRIAAESEMSDKYYGELPVFASLLADKKSYIRTRAFILCCSQARWDKDGKLRELLPEMFALLHDDKPTVVRQCLNALQEIVAFEPKLGSAIKDEINTIDLSRYKDSMWPLINKDITVLTELIEEEQQ